MALVNEYEIPLAEEEFRNEWLTEFDQMLNVLEHRIKFTLEQCLRQLRVTRENFERLRSEIEQEPK